MTTTPPPTENELSEEFRKLGQNLKQAAEAAWQSEESRKFRQELRNGLRALEAELTTGETGQRLKAEVHDFSEKVRNGEVENKVRNELLAALRSVNASLQKNGQPKPKDDQSGNMV